MDFEELVSVLNQFTLSTAPFNELEIETKLEKFLRARQISVGRQVNIENGRNDIVVARFVIELKKRGSRSCVEQLDRYSADYDGLILLCWKASKPLGVVFELTKVQARIPIALIEVSKNGDIV